MQKRVFYLTMYVIIFIMNNAVGWDFRQISPSLGNFLPADWFNAVFVMQNCEMVTQLPRFCFFF